MSDREAELRAVTVGELQPVSGQIELVDYDPAWPGLFAREAERIRAALGERVVLLEHAGSTSVPGLAAKPIIDITLAVPDSADEDVIRAGARGGRLRAPHPRARLARAPRLQGPGHERQPARLLGRAAPRSTGCCASATGSGRTRPIGELYERTKRKLAAREWTYVQDYADAKTAVVEEILARALTETS